MSDNARIPADSALSALRAEIHDFVVDIVPPDLRHLVSDQARATPLTDAEMAQAAPYLLARVEALETDLVAVRAVLTPLLDDPHEQYDAESDDGGDVYVSVRCRFCEAETVWNRRWTGARNARGHKVNAWVDETPHAADCPVLRRDALLGRTPT